MTRLFSATLALTVFTGTAIADEWTSFERVTQILVHNDSLEVTITGPGSGCERVYRLKSAEQNYDVKATATLSAYYAGHQISLFWSGDRSSCHTSFGRIKVRP